ncbi:MAG: helix-turn-helix transcriptional regulator [Flavobacteriaceae bacterium]|jgi:transcriptional regulator with XRE-family HTH domain
MLNINGIVERIEQIRINHQLTAAGFATKIGVQRSAMSHILSGRNKPSLEFLMKVYEAFEEVELEWLIVGSPSTPLPNKNETELFAADKTTPKQAEQDPPEIPQDENLNPMVRHTEKTSIQSSEGASPKEIIYLYSDGSFERFLPKK